MNIEQQTSNKKSNKLIYLVIVLLVALTGFVYLWQHKKVNDLNKQVSSLEETQLPQKQFSSIEDCNQNGGVPLSTINGEFNACLGGKEEGGDSYQAFLQYSAQNLPRIDENATSTSKLENRVDNTTGHSSDLVTFLKQNDTGCEQGYYKILKEVPNRFALLNYGCTNDKLALEGKYFIIAMRLGDGWAFLSPTNNMDDKGRPSCLLQDMFKISKDLAPKCFENTGYDNGKLKARNYQ